MGNQPLVKIDLENILFPKPVPAGMNYLLVGYLAYQMRTSTEWPWDPVIVKLEPNGAAWRITDGRHRVVAAMISGRSWVLAVEEKEVLDSTNQI